MPIKKLTKIEVNRLLDQKWSIERKLLLLNDTPLYDVEVRCTNASGDRIGIEVDREIKTPIVALAIKTLKLKRIKINSELGLYQKIKVKKHEP